MTKVAICLPSHGGAFREHEKCLAGLRLARPDWHVISLPGSPCIDIARAAVAEEALKKKPDVLLWLDADMVFSIETCEQIVAAALGKNAVVGCLYLGKKFGGAPQASFFPGTKSFTCYEHGGLLEVLAIGFGVVAVPADVFEHVAHHAKLPRLKVGPITLRPWFTTDPTGAWEEMHSDDYAFCRRVRASGIQVFADTRQRVGHIGSHIYQLEDCQQLTRHLSFTITNSDEEPAKAAE